MNKDVIMRTEVDPRTGRTDIIRALREVVYCGGCRYGERKKNGKIKCTKYIPNIDKDEMGFCDLGASKASSPVKKIF